jgi:hypothetical protein
MSDASAAALHIAADCPIEKHMALMLAQTL